MVPSADIGLARLLDRMSDVATLPLDRATTMPPEAYRSAELYDLEVERIFRKDWVCVGRIDEVAAPGDFRALDLFGEPLVLTRDQGGELHLLSNVCRHRWTAVAEGHGNTRHLQCPYHHWTYALSGELLAAPDMKTNVAFERSACALPEVRTEVWQGFIFANLDGTAEPLGTRLAGLDKLLDPYHLGSYQTVRQTEWGDSPYDWKLLVDNYLECYHHAGIHQDSVQPIFPARLSWTEGSGGEHWSVAHLPVAESAGRRNSAGELVTPTLLPPPSHLAGEQLSEILIVGVFPFLIFGVSPDFVEWYHFYPTGPGRLELTIKFCVHQQALEFPMVDHSLAGVVDCLREIHQEDLGVLEAMQRGVSSRLATEGSLSLLEEPMLQFNRYVSRMLTAPSTQTVDLRDSVIRPAVPWRV